DVNQYAITWGARTFRDALAAKVKWSLGLELDPEREITVTCGSTEGMIAALMGIIDPGDEVIVFEPFYENYGPDAILSGATPRYVTLHPPYWTFDPADLTRAFTARTKAVVLNSPNNPTGKVFSLEELETIAALCNTPNNPTGKVFSFEELEAIAALCQEHDALLVTDEIYEHITYPTPANPLRHLCPATLPGMRERTIVVNGLSKTYAVTGWRIGYVLAPPAITDAIRKVHDFLTVGAPAPLQEAGATALRLPPGYYQRLQAEYHERRDFLCGALREVGFRFRDPDGAYYVMTDFTPFGGTHDVQFAEHLTRTVGVAVVPGSSFFHDPAMGRHYVRFSFCKRMETLAEAARRLRRLRPSR
ncbi:MAG: aminotransferase class I/II-fold pyridoxal phosphate-dependent enzyme, partial [candidate division NC10 bacterium]|nr:aminotransferase class I/II-fold pyridoxal phosphate-dependent enzyme [candidate division NC10 bacterium]